MKWNKTIYYGVINVYKSDQISVSAFYKRHYTGASTSISGR